MKVHKGKETTSFQSKTDQNFEEHFLSLEGKSCPTSRGRSRTDSVSKQEVLLSSSFHADMPDNMMVTLRQRCEYILKIFLKGLFKYLFPLSMYELEREGDVTFLMGTVTE